MIEDIQTELRMRSREHDCHMSYYITKDDMDHDAVPHIIKWMKDSMERFIKEKQSAASKGKKS